MIPRIVFDTSSLIGAVLFVGSVPYRALSRALDSYQLCISAEGLTQLEEVIARRRFARLIPMGARSEFVDLIRRRSLFLPVKQSDVDEVEPSCRDATDNFILALAGVARAKVIVSSENDLLVLHPWHGIPILTPAQFLAQSDSD